MFGTPEGIILENPEASEENVGIWEHLTSCGMEKSGEHLEMSWSPENLENSPNDLGHNSSRAAQGESLSLMEF